MEYLRYCWVFGTEITYSLVISTSFPTHLCFFRTNVQHLAAARDPPKNLGSSSEAHYGIFALQKTDMEPENDGFQKGRKLLFHMSIF